MEWSAREITPPPALIADKSPRSEPIGRDHRPEKGHSASTRDSASHRDGIGTVNADGGCDPA